MSHVNLHPMTFSFVTSWKVLDTSMCIKTHILESRYVHTIQKLGIIETWSYQRRSQHFLKIFIFSRPHRYSSSPKIHFIYFFLFISIMLRTKESNRLTTFEIPWNRHVYTHTHMRTHNNIHEWRFFPRNNFPNVSRNNFRKETLGKVFGGKTLFSMCMRRMYVHVYHHHHLI